MEISVENNSLTAAPDRNIYRNNVKTGEKYHWKIMYQYSDLLLSSDKDIVKLIEEPVKEIYRCLHRCFKEDPAFLKSLSPVSIKPGYPEIIKKMCLLSAEFNVGPMAAVAGTVNEFLAEKLNKYCGNLIIENGGDLYLRSKKDRILGIYVKNNYFKDGISMKVKAKNMPCGVCASSGTFGHSLSLGKCDLAVVVSKSAIAADAAATAVANSISCKDDIFASIEHFRNYRGIDGLLLIKDDKIGLWGNIELI
jgi:ApbE superfamily uncharacterized protein (UPF0280 family)